MLLTATLCPLGNRSSRSGCPRRSGRGDRRHRGVARRDGRRAATVRRTNRPVLDVRERHRRVGVVGHNIIRVSGASRASSTGNTRLRRALVEWEVRVEPEHVSSVVAPERHDQHHAVGHGIPHPLYATVCVEVLVVTEQRLLGDTEVVGDGVVLRQRGEGGERILIGDAVLHVHATDLDQVAGGRVVISDEPTTKLLVIEASEDFQAMLTELQQ